MNNALNEKKKEKDNNNIQEEEKEEHEGPETSEGPPKVFDIIGALARGGVLFHKANSFGCIQSGTRYAPIRRWHCRACRW